MESRGKTNILVTGGCGFIGWNFIRRLYERENDYPFHKIINLDKLDYSAINTKKESYYDDRYEFIHGDMKYSSFGLLAKYDINVVVNFAAQTHVDNSIKSSYSFIQNNVVAMHMLMEEARHYWSKKGIEGKFIQISTDEIFGSVEDNNGHPFTENTPYHPNNPYSASKASAEMLLKSYVNTYNFPGIITNCSNNYGPGQHSEKLIPKIIHNSLNGKNIPIYGDGKQARDWIYVDDHCDGILETIHKGKIGESYLFGTNEIIYNKDLAQNILKNIPNNTSVIEHVTDRLGHDRTYRIDYSKAYSELGWYPKINLKTGLEKTINWYLTKNN